MLKFFCVWKSQISRPVGSTCSLLIETYRKTVEYLLTTLRSFQEAKRDDIILDIDLQRPSGSFSMDFLEGLTSYYKNVSNVVARISLGYSVFGNLKFRVLLAPLVVS